MAKKSNYSIEEAYAAEAPVEETEEVVEQAPPTDGLSLSGEDVAQMQALKSNGDQSGDYSELGAYLAQIMGGSAPAA